MSSKHSLLDIPKSFKFCGEYVYITEYYSQKKFHRYVSEDEEVTIVELQTDNLAETSFEVPLYMIKEYLNN